MLVVENAEKNSLYLNGSFPGKSKFEKERFFPETIVQIGVGTLAIYRYSSLARLVLGVIL